MKSPEESPAPPKRIQSIDTLRGFDMLMISGAGSFIYLLHGKTGAAWVDALAMQFEHPAWNGFTFYDFIFPLFLFLAGMSLPFSVDKSLDQGLSKSQIYWRAFRRMLILIILGILDKNAPTPYFDWSQIRFVGVLQRIGFAGFVVTLLYVNFNARKRTVWFVCLLLFYYAAMFLIPVPGYGSGDLSIEGNLHGWIDRNFLPGRLLQKIYDENGLLTQIPALCLTLLGTLASDILRKETLSDHAKLRYMIISGVLSVGVALIWSLHFPINKHLWSSSFIMLTGGMSLLAFALFYWIIDILKYRRWTFFFVVIGMNSLTIYLVNRFIDFGYTSKLLFEGFYAAAPEEWHPVFQSLGALVIVWLFLYVLYRRKIFIKI